MPQDLDPASIGAPQTDDRIEQHGLPGAGTANESQDLPALHLQFQVLVNDIAAELRQQSLDMNDRLGCHV